MKRKENEEKGDKGAEEGEVLRREDKKENEKGDLLQGVWSRRIPKISFNPLFP